MFVFSAHIFLSWKRNLLGQWISKVVYLMVHDLIQQVVSSVLCHISHLYQKQGDTISLPFLKVSKSQNIFFLKLHCPKNEQNIRQNSALESEKRSNQKDKDIR